MNKRTFLIIISLLILSFGLYQTYNYYSYLNWIEKVKNTNELKYLKRSTFSYYFSTYGDLKFFNKEVFKKMIGKEELYFDDYSYNLNLKNHSSLILYSYGSDKTDDDLTKVLTVDELSEKVNFIDYLFGSHYDVVLLDINYKYICKPLDYNFRYILSDKNFPKEDEIVSEFKKKTKQFVSNNLLRDNDSIIGVNSLLLTYNGKDLRCLCNQDSNLREDQVNKLLTEFKSNMDGQFDDFEIVRFPLIFPRYNNSVVKHNQNY